MCLCSRTAEWILFLLIHVILHSLLLPLRFRTMSLTQKVRSSILNACCFHGSSDEKNDFQMVRTTLNPFE